MLQKQGFFSTLFLYRTQVMYIEPMIIDHVCKHPSMIEELKQGVIINQKVYSKDNQLLVNVKIDQEKCSQQVKN